MTKVFVSTLAFGKEMLRQKLGVILDKNCARLLGIALSWFFKIVLFLTTFNFYKGFFFKVEYCNCSFNCTFFNFFLKFYRIKLGNYKIDEKRLYSKDNDNAPPWELIKTIFFVKIICLLRVVYVIRTIVV